MDGLLDRAYGERPRASRFVHVRGLDLPTVKRAPNHTIRPYEAAIPNLLEPRGRDRPQSRQGQYGRRGLYVVRELAGIGYAVAAPPDDLSHDTMA
jgi:hypothetical protein